MTRNQTTTMVLSLLLLATTPAWSQLEPIGPLVLVPHQPIHWVFTNEIPPRPDYKELEFTGLAHVPAGAFGLLQIDFDYLDAAGNFVVVPAPHSPIPIPGGEPFVIESGILRLPFCPLEVSLQLANVGTATGVPIELEGVFRHECFPVPEPGGLGLISLVGVALTAWRRRRWAA